MLTAQRLRELIGYDPITGSFTRIVKRTNAGTGQRHRDGYIYLYVERKTYSAHRLAWLYVTGEWPKYDIDHINGVKDDNRFVNLRDASTTINMQNEIRARVNNASGLMGAVWRKDRKKWVSTIRVNGKSIRLGSFATPEDASNAYLEGKRLYHPGFTL